MEEARFSINIKFSVKGFDSQLTVRGDEGTKLQADFDAALAFLGCNDCQPERRWENGRNGGNGHTNGQAVQTKSADKQFVDLGAGPATIAVIAQPKPVAATVARAQVENPNTRPCPNCGVSGEMELISFNDRKSGQPKSAYKCQACKKWLK